MCDSKDEGKRQDKSEESLKPSKPATSREILHLTYSPISTMCSRSRSMHWFPEQSNGSRFGPEFPYKDSFHFLCTPNAPVHIKNPIAQVT